VKAAILEIGKGAAVGIAIHLKIKAAP